VLIIYIIHPLFVVFIRPTWEICSVQVSGHSVRHFYPIGESTAQLVKLPDRTVQENQSGGTFERLFFTFWHQIEVLPSCALYRTLESLYIYFTEWEQQFEPIQCLNSMRKCFEAPIQKLSILSINYL